MIEAKELVTINKNSDGNIYLIFHLNNVVRKISPKAKKANEVVIVGMNINQYNKIKENLKQKYFVINLTGEENE